MMPRDGWDVGQDLSSINRFLVGVVVYSVRAGSA